MIYAAINSVQNDLAQLQSLMQQLASVWNDRVSEHISEALLTAVVSNCNSFANEASTAAMMVLQNEETLNNLLCG